MQKWFVRFIGYTITKAGSDLPKQIFQDFNFDADNEEHAAAITTQLSLQLLAQGAMVVPRSSNQTVNDASTLIVPKRMIVPMHMIWKIEHIAKQLTVLPPTMLADVAQFETGDEPKPSVN
jgi:hypothetical protein